MADENSTIVFSPESNPNDHYSLFPPYEDNINDLIYEKYYSEYGGYKASLLKEHQFNDLFKCNLCKGITVNRVKLGCSHIFCNSCILFYIKTRNETDNARIMLCPVTDCNTQIYEESCANLCLSNNSVKDCIVECPLDTRGCTWSNTLPLLLQHINNCRFVRVTCPNSCSKIMFRGDIKVHEEMCYGDSFKESSIENSSKILDETQILKYRIEEYKSELTRLNSELILTQTKTKEQYERILHLENNTINTSGVFHWTICNVASLIMSDEIKMSTPIFTHNGGYKVRFRLVLHGQGSGKGAYASLFFCLMCGPYDHLLAWPFQGIITFTLFNQQRNADHYVQVGDFGPHNSDSRLLFRPTKDSTAGRGQAKLISHTELTMVSQVRQFVVNDTLFLKCQVQASNMMKCPWVFS